MPLYEFSNADIIDYRIKAHPKHHFFIYGSSSFYNNRPGVTGSFDNWSNQQHNNIRCINTSSGEVGTALGGAGRSIAFGAGVSLYELNVDRPSGSTIFPFLTKQGSRSSFKTITTKNHNTQFSYGDSLSGSYPMSASIHIEYFDEDTTGTTRRRIDALKTSIENYGYFSPHFAMSSDRLKRNFQTSSLALISIPSIYYGSSIEKGSVDLRFFLTGTLIGRAQDEQKNGLLVQTGPNDSNHSGTVVGIVLYNEGMIILTGSQHLNPKAAPSLHLENYELNTAPDDVTKRPTWKYFGTSIEYSGNPHINGAASAIVSSSYSLAFSGTMLIPVKTMFAHAPKGNLNFSNNPTYVKKDQTTMNMSSSLNFTEDDSREIKNIASSSYKTHKESFEKNTYISKIGLYDKDKNLIAIAKLAKPVKKTEEREYTFKLKLDF